MNLTLSQAGTFVSASLPMTEKVHPKRAAPGVCQPLASAEGGGTRASSAPHAPGHGAGVTCIYTLVISALFPVNNIFYSLRGFFNPVYPDPEQKSSREDS